MFWREGRRRGVHPMSRLRTLAFDHLNLFKKISVSEKNINFLDCFCSIAINILYIRGICGKHGGIIN